MVLSYDDGPSEYTDTLLDILAAQNQKATLCMVGRYDRDKTGSILFDWIANTAFSRHLQARTSPSTPTLSSVLLRTATISASTPTPTCTSLRSLLAK
jgi:hypothetical protein